MYTNHQKKFKSITLSIVIFLLGVSLFVPSVSAQLFQDSNSIEISTNETTPIYLIGNISLSGSFQGIQFDQRTNSIQQYISFLQEISLILEIPDFTSLAELYGFPLFSETRLNDATVFVINTTYLSSINEYSAVELISLKDEIVTSFSDVSINVKQGIALFGSDAQKYQVNHNQSYGFGGFFQLPFNSQLPSNGIGIISDEKSLFTVQTNTSLVYPYNSEIDIIDGENVVYHVSQSDQIILIKTSKNVSLHQHSTVHFFPLLTDDNSSSEALLSITQINSPSNDILSLLDDFTETMSSIDDSVDQSVFPINQQLQTVIPYLSELFNSGIILTNTSNDVRIDGKNLSNPMILAGRGPQFTLTLNQQESSPVSIQGESTLLFVDDHFYTSTAENSENGITLPLISILLWIAAIVSILFYWSLKTKHRLLTKNNDAFYLFQKRWVRILIYGIILGILFLLVDLQFSFRFGLSLITQPAAQNNALITLIFFLIQSIILVFLFFLYAFPAVLIHNMICRTTIKNNYQFLTKLIILIPFFWVGLHLYFLVLLNIFLSIIPLPSITGLG